MRYTEIFEADHEHGDRQPMVRGDRVRVFHGFRDLPDAVKTARHGLTGKERASRVYSYESDNNPKGLFVTMNPKIAQDFGGVVIEFMADFADLDAPVWPGGSYTVQGGLSQYFGRGPKGRAARAQRGRDAEEETMGYVKNDPDYLAHVAASEKKYLTYLLTGTREQQALFVGDLEPQQIMAFYLRPERYDQPWEKLTLEQFLERYAETKTPHNDKVFSPSEEFSGEEFLARLGKNFGGEAHVDEVFRDQWTDLMKKEPRGRSAAFANLVGDFLWPRQLIPAMKWMRARYR